MVINNGSPNKLILIKPNQMKETELVKYYGNNFTAISIPEGAVARKELINDLKEAIPAVTKCILVADTDMFKTLCKVKKTSNLDGIPCDNVLNIPAFIVPNYFSFIYNPEAKNRLDFIMSKVNAYILGVYKQIGDDIVEHSEHPSNRQELKQFLNKLNQYEKIAIDIETTSNHLFNLTPEEEKKFKSGLHHFSNRLYSLAFAWNKHEGGSFIYQDEYKDLLVKFFISYKGTLIFHNAGFDITQLIYHLFMSHLEDYVNMLVGLHTLCNKIEDTMLISYLALNSCNKPNLNLKGLSHEYTGNYAEDVSDCTKIPIKDLLIYNLKDVLATWYVYEKYYPIMIKDNQEEIYKTLFLPSLKTLIETQLVGLRIYPDKLRELSTTLKSNYQNTLDKIINLPKVKEVEQDLRIQACNKYNKEHKKQKTIDDFKDIVFNPSSTPHLIQLLYDKYALPVLDMTDKGTPACGTDTLEKLKHHVENQEVKDLLDNLISLSQTDKIITAFIPSFEHTVELNGMKCLYGSFKLGGTVSGRLTSSSPNLQQIPSTGSPYAKPVKKIFGSPKGYVFCGADQRSLIY